MGRASALKDLRPLKDRPFRVKDAAGLGVPGYELRRLRDSGDLIELARGVYQRADAAPDAAIDLATISVRAPEATIAANSALAYWELTDEIPSTVHLAVKRGSHRPQISYPPTTVHVFAADTYALGRVHQGPEAGGFWIYSPERAIADAMRLPTIIGRDQALGALRRYLSTHGARPAELIRIADELRTGPSLRHALEVLLT
jgi:predicted transcriptional regulator of viral defense system